jgi:hypothetical protein
MTTAVVPADWIMRIVDEERKRDAVRVRDEETAARKAELVRLNGRRLLDELRSAVARDVDAFRSEFVGDPRRDIILRPTENPEGFVVRRPESPAVTLTVTARLKTALMDCEYGFTSRNGLPPREHRFELGFAADGAEALQIKDQRTGHVFVTADALSEYLLGPVFTGRPR